jgi:hypothetical protein
VLKPVVEPRERARHLLHPVAAELVLARCVLVRVDALLARVRVRVRVRVRDRVRVRGRGRVRVRGRVRIRVS